MSRPVKQPTVIMLTMDLQKHGPSFPHEPDRNRLVIHEGTTAPINPNTATQDQKTITIQPISTQCRANGMTGRRIENS